MAATAEQAQKIARNFIDNVYVAQRQIADCNKDDLIAAAEAAYNWVESNQVSFNAALTNPFKATATLRQKAEILRYAIQELVLAS